MITRSARRMLSRALKTHEVILTFNLRCALPGYLFLIPLNFSISVWLIVLSKGLYFALTKNTQVLIQDGYKATGSKISMHQLTVGDMILSVKENHI